MSAKKMKFPIQEFPIRGGILTPARRAAAMKYAIAQLEARSGDRSDSQSMHRTIKIKITPAKRKL